MTRVFPAAADTRTFGSFVCEHAELNFAPNVRAQNEHTQQVQITKQFSFLAH